MAFDLLVMFLAVIGFAYLFFVTVLAFKQQTKIVFIVILNVLIFVYTYFFRPELIGQYALSGAKVSAGMGYTLISSMFLHGSVSHILLNSFGLLFFGYQLEKELSWPPVLMIYFMSGVAGGALFILTSDPRALVVGASGGIFGLMAFLTLIRPFRISPMPFLIPMPVAVASVLYVIFIAPAAIAAGVGNVAHTAHLGGLLGGSLMAFAMNHLKALRGLMIVIIIALLAFILPPLFI